MKIRNFRPPFGVNRSASGARKSRGHFAPESDRRRALPAAYRARPVWLLHVFFLLFRLFLRERLELLGRRPGGRFLLVPTRAPWPCHPGASLRSTFWRFLCFAGVTFPLPVIGLSLYILGDFLRAKKKKKQTPPERCNEFTKNTLFFCPSFLAPSSSSPLRLNLRNCNEQRRLAQL